MTGHQLLIQHTCEATKVLNPSRLNGLEKDLHDFELANSITDFCHQFVFLISSDSSEIRIQVGEKLINDKVPYSDAECCDLAHQVFCLFYDHTVRGSHNNRLCFLRPQHEKIDDFFDYIKALVTTILESQGNIHLHSDDWHRTIYIDTLGVATTDFGLSDALKRKLEDSGRKGAKAYFNWFDSKKSKPANRPKSYLF